MRVPKHDHVWMNLLNHLSVTRFKLMQLAEDVTNENRPSCQCFQALNGKSSETVVVAFDSEYGGDLFQSVDHFELPDVTRVYDCIDALEDRNDRFIKQPVSI